MSGHDRATIPPPAVKNAAQAAPSVASDERALVAAVLQKDRKATAEFVVRYADPVYAYVRHRLAPRTDLVEDLVHDVFLVGLEQLQTFAGQSSVQGWLLGIARHKIETYYRTRLREPETVAEFDEESAVTLPDIDMRLDEARLQKKTRQILARLPEPQALALLWRYWEQRSAKEMAEQSGKTVKAIERLLARARARFRQLWDAEPT